MSPSSSAAMRYSSLPFRAVVAVCSALLPRRVVCADYAAADSCGLLLRVAVAAASGGGFGLLLRSRTALPSVAPSRISHFLTDSVLPAAPSFSFTSSPLLKGQAIANGQTSETLVPSKLEPVRVTAVGGTVAWVR